MRGILTGIASRSSPEQNADRDQPQREDVDERDPGDRHDQEPDREADARPAEPDRKRARPEGGQAGGQEEHRAGQPGRVIEARRDPETDLRRSRG